MIPTKDLFNLHFESAQFKDQERSIWIFRTDRSLDHVPSKDMKQMSQDLWARLRNPNSKNYLMNQKLPLPLDFIETCIALRQNPEGI